MIFLVKWQQELIHYQVLAENDQNSILCDPRKNKSMKLWEAALTHIIITTQQVSKTRGLRLVSHLEFLWKSFRSPSEVL